MPSSSRRAAPRRSPRAAPRPTGRAALPAGRPLSAPFAAVFAVLTAAEGGYLASLLRPPEPRWDWIVATPAALAALALAGGVLVLLGRGRGWLVLAVAAALSALLLLGVALLFGALGDGGSAGWALAMLVGPLGAFVLAVRRPIRDWTRPRRRTPSPSAARPGRAGARGG
jgi:hypothetical protein